MLNQRIKQLRLARGLSLDQLAARMDHIVSKQSLSKYEQNKTQPSARVLTKIALALGIKTIDLLGEKDINVEFIAYRKGGGLPKKEEKRVKNLVTHSLAERIRLQVLTDGPNGIEIPVQDLKVRSFPDAERAAQQMRSLWNLGTAPIANLTIELEDHQVHVFEIDAHERFDGIAAVAYSSAKRVKSAAIVTRRGLTGERQRLNLAHELGHLVLKTYNKVDEEKAAFRFAAAFLAPKETILHEVGQKRRNIGLKELLLLKRQFGLSAQALLRRLLDLEVINKTAYRQWCIHINQMGWKKQEPLELPAEQPQWLLRHVLRASSEGLISKQEAERLIDKQITIDIFPESGNRREFAEKSLKYRRRILAKQAEQLAAFYEQDESWKELQGGDIIEY